MPEEPEDLMLGAYRVLRKDDGSHWVLGRGGYGTTYKAEHIHLERICALKVINENLVRDERAAQRFLQEARIAASLDHPNIARIYDFGRCDGVFYYAMSFCSGGDLDRYSATHGPQPWSVVKGLALQILGALETAHQKGLLHRDLKPSNVMLAADDGTVDLRLIDFGLVKALDDGSGDTNLAQTREGTFMGSPLTASPEQFRVEALDARSDLYSLGITLWCLLHGGPPFHGVSVAQIAHQRLSPEGHLRQIPAYLEPEAKYVLRKLLATDKEHRFRDCAETREAIVKGIVGPEEDFAEAAVAEGGSPTQDWEYYWEIGARLARFPYGSYYSCRGKAAHLSHATLFVPDAEAVEFEQIKDEARKLLGSNDFVLANFSQEGELGGTDCFLCPPFPSGNFQYLLQAAGSLNLRHHLSLFQQIASAVDEAAARGIAGIEMEDHEILLGVGSEYPHPLVTAEDWARYFETDGDPTAGPLTGLRAMVLPKLLGSSSADVAPSATISGDDMAPSPIRRYAGFLYHAFSGRLVNPGAYFSSAAYVTTSNISEESNRYLKEVMSGTETPESAMALLRHLSRSEMGSWNTKQLEYDLSVRVTTYHSQADSPLPGSTPVSKTPVQPWYRAGNSAVPSALEPTRVITTPVAPEPTPVPAPFMAKARSLPAKVGGKPVKLIVGIAAAVLVLAAVGVKLLIGPGGGKKEDDGGDGPAEVAETGALKFAEVAVGTVPPPGSLQLMDKAGAVLGDFKLTGKTAVVEGFPRALFDATDRWPLMVSLRAEEKGHIMPTVELRKSQFAPDGEGVLAFSGPLALNIRTYFETEPNLTLDGAPLELPASAYSNDLRPVKSGLAWALTTEGKKLGIALPEGETFPVKATLALPLTTPLTVELGPTGTSRWNLEIPKRKLKFAGRMPAFSTLAFEPDFTALRNEAYRTALAGAMKGSTVSARDFNLAGKQWELPKADGTVVAKWADGTGEARLKIAPLTSVKLIVNGSDGEANEPASVVKERALAERGDVDSQMRLALDYIEMGAMERSLEWFRLAATEGKGDPRAQVSLGTAYLTGSGVPENPAEAVKWFERAIANGESDGKAHNNLGFCYERGAGVALDLAKAKEHYGKAIEQGWVEAMVSLGILLTNEGNGISDPDRGVKLFQDAMKLKSVAAIRELGYCYANGIGPLEVDRDKARDLLREAVAKGDKTAEGMLEDIGK